MNNLLKLPLLEQYISENGYSSNFTVPFLKRKSIVQLQNWKDYLYDLADRMNKLKNTRQCWMCGLTLPPLAHYDSNRCWMCWRNIWEKDYHRYYIKTRNSHWEEAQSIRGLSNFKEENQSIIKKMMKIAKEQLKKELTVP